MYSILGRESDASRVKLSEGIFEKLNFSFFMSYKQKDFVSELLSCDGDAITERQKLFSAIDKSSALFEAFEALAKGAENIAEYRKELRFGTKELSNERMFYAFRELMYYTECTDTLLGVADIIEACDSHALHSLLQKARDVYSSDWYKNAREYISAMDENIKHIRSVSIGINLDSELRPLEAGIISVNSEPYVTNTVFDKMFSKKVENKNMICIAPLGKKEATLSGTAMRAFDVNLYSALNDYMRGSLKKIKSVLGNMLDGACNFLCEICDELRFIRMGMNYMLAVRSKGMPLCFPAFSDKLDISGLYNPNLLAEMQSCRIVKNDVHFDENGRIFILTGPNSGGKSVYLRALGIAQILFSLGLPIPAESAAMPLCSEILAQFSVFTSESGAGRLEGECRAIAKICSAATENSLILLDELFSGTSSEDGAIIAEKTLEWLSAKNCRVLYATHIHEIASYADEINKSERSRGKIDFLCAELQGKERSYKIVRGKRSRGSYAMDIFEKYGIGFLAEK